jgi:hypothetical protein
MSHTLNLTNGVRLLAHNLLHIPESFKTPSEILRAGHLIEKLDCPVVANDEVTTEFLTAGEGTLELSEAQRDLLKMVVEKHAAKLPPSKHLMSLLTQLGFEA